MTVLGKLFRTGEFRIAGNLDERAPAIAEAQENDYLQLDFTMVAATNSYYYADMTEVADYVVEANNYLEYEIYWETSVAAIAVDFTCSDGATLRGGPKDQNGQDAHPNANISDYANQKWYARRFPLGSYIGRTITQWDLACEKDQAGTYIGRVRNIRITDGTGNTVHSVWVVGDQRPVYSQHLSSTSGNSLVIRKKNEARGLLAHFPMDGGKRIKPLAHFNRWNLPADVIESTHPTYPDLFKTDYKGHLVTIPGLAGSRFVVVEFDLYWSDINTQMFMGFLGNTDGQYLNIYSPANTNILGVNGWSSQYWGADLSSRLNTRFRVTYVIDAAETNNTRVYIDGVEQSMTGAPMNGARILTDQVVLGAGNLSQPVNGNYINRNYWGNLNIYRLDVDSIEEVEAVFDVGGLFVGQPAERLSPSADNNDWSTEVFSILGTNTVTKLGDGRWRIANTGDSWSQFRFAWDPSQLVDGQTYSTSLKYRIVTGEPGSELAISDFCDNAINTRVAVEQPDYVWAYGRGTRASYNNVYCFTDFLLSPLTTVEVWDIQLEHAYHASAFGDRADFGSFNFTSNLPVDHTIVAKKRLLCDSEPVHTAVVKSGSVFTYYEDGVPTTAHENHWRLFAYHRDTVNGTFAGADNLKEVRTAEQTDGVGIYSSFSTVHEGYLMRTFVYSDADVRIWHRYLADNYGRIRVNGRDDQSLGTWNTPVNPDVYIDLKVGWNVIELWGMDADSGGTVLTLTSNTGGLNEDTRTSTNVVPSVKLSEHPNVLYMTSELPIDYFNEFDGAGYTHGVNSFIHSLSIYDRPLSAADVKKLAGSKFSITRGGDILGQQVVEAENLWPKTDMSNATYGVQSIAPTVGDDGTGTYHQVTFSNTAYRYIGYDVSGLEVGATYVAVGEFWRSAGSTPTYVTLAIEGSGTQLSGYDRNLWWNTIPEETWTRSVSNGFVVDADGTVRILVYPTGGAAGSGTFRWRKIRVFKLPTKAMSAGATLNVSELVEQYVLS